MAYTVFSSYILEPNNGYSKAIHCNYIKAVVLNTSTPDIMEMNMNFPYEEDFKFLSTNNNVTGYVVHKIYALIQIVPTNVKPIASNWKKIDITPFGHSPTLPLTAAELTANTFKISLNHYYDTPSLSNPFKPYDLTYLNYPPAIDVDQSGNDDLSFGDEKFFLGNVTTDIHADVFVTDLSINLPLNLFNSSTNPTWKAIPQSQKPPVSITEIGIYDDSTPKNLVAIAKLNDPISKDGTINRTILFALDF